MLECNFKKLFRQVLLLARAHKSMCTSMEILRPKQGYIYNYMNNIYSTLFKIQERKSDRRSKEIEQRKESQNTHIKQGWTCDLTALTLNYLAASKALKNIYLSI